MAWHLSNSEDLQSAAGVEELQGVYDAFSLPDRLLQKIWLQGDFD